MSVSEDARKSAQAEEYGRQAARAGKGLETCPFRHGSASHLRNVWMRAHESERADMKRRSGR